MTTTKVVKVEEPAKLLTDKEVCDMGPGIFVIDKDDNVHVTFRERDGDMALLCLSDKTDEWADFDNIPQFRIIKKLEFRATL